MFYDDLMNYTAFNYARSKEVASSWMQPPIIYQPVEEFGDDN